MKVINRLNDILKGDIHIVPRFFDDKTYRVILGKVKKLKLNVSQMSAIVPPISKIQIYVITTPDFQNPGLCDHYPRLPMPGLCDHYPRFPKSNSM